MAAGRRSAVGHPLACRPLSKVGQQQGNCGSFIAQVERRSELGGILQKVDFYLRSRSTLGEGQAALSPQHWRRRQRRQQQWGGGCWGLHAACTWLSRVGLLVRGQRQDASAKAEPHRHLPCSSSALAQIVGGLPGSDREASVTLQAAAAATSSGHLTHQTSLPAASRPSCKIKGNEML